MIKKVGLLFLVFTFLFNIAIASPYIIENNKVFINDSKAYISAEPHILKQSGWVNINIMSKMYTGDIDIVFGFNTTNTIPSNPEFWKNVSKSYTCLEQFNYTLDPNIFWCYYLNGTIIYSNVFETGDIPLKTAYWVDKEWKSFNIDNVINYNYNNKNKWYTIENQPITANISNLLHFFINITGSGKYDIAIKPSGQNIAQAINAGNFYMLDPWWNESNEAATLNNNCTDSFWITNDNGSSTTKTNLDGSLRNGMFFETYLISWWAFENNTNDELCVNDGTNNGANFIASGQVDGAYDFDGSSEYISTPSISLTDITLSIWVKADILDAGYRTFFDTGTLLFTKSNVNKIHVNREGHSTSIDSTASLTTAWTHIAVTLDSSATKIYINGSLDSTHGVETFTSGIINIGRWTAGFQYFGGTIDEPSVYNRTLNATEIQQIFNTTRDGYRIDSTKNKYFSIINDTGELINWVFPTLNFTGVTPNMSISTDNASTFTNISNGTNTTITSGQWVSFNLTLGVDTLLSNLGMLSGFVSVGGDSCTPPGSGNYEINMTDECVFTTSFDITPGNITFVGTSGNATFNTTINISNLDIPPSNTILFIGSNTQVNIEG